MKYAARMLTIAVMMMPLLASAQLGKDSKLVAQVPFSFMAENRTLPAGEYSLQSATVTGTALSIRNWDAKASLISIVTSAEPQKGAGVNALVFHKYGDRYFLAGMELADTGAIYTLPRGEAETEMRAQNVPSTNEVVLVALN